MMTYYLFLTISTPPKFAYLSFGLQGTFLLLVFCRYHVAIINFEVFELFTKKMEKRRTSQQSTRFPEIRFPESDVVVS